MIPGISTLLKILFATCNNMQQGLRPKAERTISSRRNPHLVGLVRLGSELLKYRIDKLKILLGGCP